MIKQVSLNHKGGLYLYSFHQAKAKSLCSGFTSLIRYLDSMFLECPNDFFNHGPRSSMLKFKFEADVKKIKGHEVSSLAYYGLRENKDTYKSNHLKVQRFMLENDDKTIAIEVPIWLSHNEFSQYFSLFKTREPLSGHIDIIRIEDGKIWVWDYKPNALSEEFATTQTFFYALMLSVRTNISLEKFRCGYFDSEDTCIFKPDLSAVLKQRSLNSYI